MLKLKVKVININPAQKHEVLEKCPVLRDYSIFIDTIRKYQEQRVDNVYEKAIHECIDKGILADYLRVHGSEVVNMLMSCTVLCNTLFDNIHMPPKYSHTRLF